MLPATCADNGKHSRYLALSRNQSWMYSCALVRCCMRPSITQSAATPVSLIVILLSFLLLISCGGNGVPIGPPDETYAHTGTLVSVLQVDPHVDPMSLQMKIRVKSLTPQSGGTSLSPAHTLDVLEEFSQYSGFSTVFDSGVSVPIGTYSQVTLAFSSPRLTVLDASTTPPQPVLLTPTLTNAEITVPITPALQIREYNASAILVRINLANSLERDNQGRYTGKITPSVTVTADNGPGSTLALDEQHSVIYSLNTGTFSLRGFNVGLDSALYGGTHIVQVDDRTSYVGVSKLEDLKKGHFVTLRGAVSDQGSIYAGEVMAEALEDSAQNKAAFLGLVTSVSPGSLTLLVREEAPVLTNLDATGNIAQAGWSPGVQFGVAAAKNALKLPFSEANLLPGQSIVVHGTAHQGSPITVDASAMMLRRQAVLISGAYDFAIASDDKTGGFSAQMTESGTGMTVPITVITGSSTSFINVRNLRDIVALDGMSIKGLIYWQAQAGSLNGKSWPAGSRVLVAEQITRVAM